MNELNLKFHGNENPFYDVDRIIEEFRRELSLFEAQLERGHLSHSQCFIEFRAGFPEYGNSSFKRRLFMTFWRDFHISTELNVAFFCSYIRNVTFDNKLGNIL